MQGLLTQKDPGDVLQAANEFVSPQAFPAWYFAEIVVAGEFRVVSIFHVSTPSGVVPYWYEDPDNQHRALPLFKSLNATLLGDYGSFLARDSNLQIFVAICKTIDDLPDPLLAVQTIRWVNRRQMDKRYQSSHLHELVTEGLNFVKYNIRRRRKEFEHVMAVIFGAGKK